jgi:predicted RNase H-like HicB family nuclease
MSKKAGRYQLQTSVGDSRDEVERLIQEAIEFHLDGMREEGIPIPPQSSS